MKSLLLFRIHSHFRAAIVNTLRMCECVWVCVCVGFRLFVYIFSIRSVHWISFVRFFSLSRISFRLRSAIHVVVMFAFACICVQRTRLIRSKANSLLYSQSHWHKAKFPAATELTYSYQEGYLTQILWQLHPIRCMCIRYIRRHPK